jgi:hypothetical protein
LGGRRHARLVATLTDVLRQLLRVTPQIQRPAVMIGDTVAHVLPTLAVPLEVAMLELDLCTIIRVRP